MAGPGLLTVEDIEVVYNHSILAIRGLSLEVREGEIVALLGANGAGKSTALKAISGVLKAEHGQITRGRVELAGERIDTQETDFIVRRGAVQVLEGRRLFNQLTVEENLLMGGYGRPDRTGVASDLDVVFALFPRLRERRRQSAGYLSGGEQQMVAIGRALMARPRIMLLDEPSMGLAPLLVHEVFNAIARLRRERGLSVLLAEQNVKAALSVVDRGYVLESGRLVLAGTAVSLQESARMQEFYLGLSIERGVKDDAATGGPRQSGVQHMEGA